ncbi:unnamed protein product [Caenorhabditis brenneri]
MYRLVLSYLNPLLFVLAMIDQPIVIYTIIRHSPSNLKALKTVLLNTSCFQISHSISAFLTQFRQVSNLTPVEIWSYGPIRHQEAYICYILYHILQTSAMVSGLSAFLTIYMKYDAAKYVIPSRNRVRRVVVVLVLLVAVSVACEIILIFIQSLPAEIRENYRQINQNTTEHANIGFVDLRVIPSRINHTIISFQVFAFPILTFYLRRSIFSQVVPGNDDRVSIAKREQTKTFLNGLTIQVMLPVGVLVPVFFGQLLALVTKGEFLLQQYLIFVLPVLPTVCDPIITLYFVTPYRKQVKIWLRMKDETARQPSPSAFIVT